MEKLIFLLKKYEQGVLDKNEEKTLLELLNKPENKKVASGFLEDNYILENNELSFDTEVRLNEALSIINTKLKKETKVVRFPRRFKYAIAAGLTLFMGISIFWFLSESKSTNKENKQQIVLELPDGSKKILNQGNSNDTVVSFNTTLKSWVFNGKSIYKEPENNISEGMSKLYVPHGENFNLQLADGTKVRLNAGSTLSFPVGFQSYMERRVFLNGEAFFQVKRDTTKQFIVDTGSMEVTVLGTKFNVSSYQEDSFENATVLEGLVEVSQDTASVVLKENEQAMAIRESNLLRKQTVVFKQSADWLFGELIFNRTPFKKIAIKLERTYNIKIIYNKGELDDKEFTATFREENVEEILTYLGESYGFKVRKEGKIFELY